MAESTVRAYVAAVNFELDNVLRAVTVPQTVRSRQRDAGVRPNKDRLVFLLGKRREKDATRRIGTDRAPLELETGGLGAGKVQVDVEVGVS